jgi:flagellar hook-associated protein 3 FlgL
MRIADKMNFDQVNSSLSRNRSELVELQNQAATQKRVNKPSDDPLAATRVLGARTEVAGNAQFLKSVSQARTFLEYSEQSLGELGEVLTRAKELALAQANDASSSKQSREVTATEVDQLFEQSVQIGNRKLGDRFLFGGFRTTRAPFDYQGGYRGDSGEIQISIQKEAKVAMNIPGNKVFLGIDTKAPASAGPGQSPHLNSSKPEATPAGEEDRNVQMRGPASASAAEQTPASATTAAPVADLSPGSSGGGVNVFKVLKELTTGLRANDKESVQESLDQLDAALAQVILSRSQLGSRVATLNGAMESLQKGQVDAKTLASSLEDVDTFELVNELNKSESTLKASLASSGKLIQPSLLDFLR